jgi:type IV secretory pathway VirB4 component
MANEASTQNLVEVSEVRDEVLILKSGSLRSIIEVSAINFELRSEAEQTALIENFQNFLNSVDFPIEIIIHSRKMQIDDYLKYVQEQSKDLDELLKIQAAEYGRFVGELSGLANIMSKNFYLAIPFFIFENPQKVGLGLSLKGIFKPSQAIKQITEEQIQTYKNQLMQRAELIFDGLVSLGVKARMLQGEELIKVLYGFYNPGSALTNVPKE